VSETDLTVKWLVLIFLLFLFFSSFFFWPVAKMETMEKEESSGITISCLVSFLDFVVRLASDWRKNIDRIQKKKKKREKI
jgi:hypothetical protein